MKHEPVLFAVEKKVIEDVVNYLATRPWREVNGMIAALSQVRPVVQQESDKD
jgi:hypothetical protein